MHARAQVAIAGIAAGIGLLAVLGLSLVLPALASPVALAIGAAGGLAVAYRDRLPYETRSFRRGLVLLAIISAALVWLNLQPAYIGI